MTVPPQVVETQPLAVPEEADDLEGADEPQNVEPRSRGGFWAGLLLGLGIAALIFAGVKLKQRRDRRDFIRRS